MSSKVVGFILDNKNMIINNNNEDSYVIGFINHGTHNGYVVVSPECSLYGRTDILGYKINVHGGISYMEYFMLKNKSFLNGMKIKKDFIGKRNPIVTNREVVYGDYNEIKDDWIIYGFDTFHFGDSKDIQNKDFVINETLNMVKAFEYDLSKDGIFKRVKELFVPEFVFQEKDEDEYDFDEKLDDMAIKLLNKCLFKISEESFVLYDFIKGKIIQSCDYKEMKKWCKEKILENNG